MGQNLIMNAADHGFKVIAFNRTVSKVDRFLENEAKGMLSNQPAQGRIVDNWQECRLKAHIQSRNSFRSSRNRAG